MGSSHVASIAQTAQPVLQTPTILLPATGASGGPGTPRLHFHLQPQLQLLRRILRRPPRHRGRQERQVRPDRTLTRNLSSTPPRLHCGDPRDPPRTPGAPRTPRPHFHPQPQLHPASRTLRRPPRPTANAENAPTALSPATSAPPRLAHTAATPATHRERRERRARPDRTFICNLSFSCCSALAATPWQRGRRKRQVRPDCTFTRSMRIMLSTCPRTNGSKSTV